MAQSHHNCYVKLFADVTHKYAFRMIKAALSCAVKCIPLFFFIPNVGPHVISRSVSVLLVDRIIVLNLILYHHQI